MRYFMSSAQIHLALNHFPIAGMIISLIVLLWGLLTKIDDIKTVGVTLMLLSSVLGFVVAQTGDGAEEIVEHKPLVTEKYIHEHEQAADNAMVVIDFSAFLGVAWFILRWRKNIHLEKLFYLITLSVCFSSILIANAAHKGGQIRHDEIRLDSLVKVK